VIHSFFFSIPSVFKRAGKKFCRHYIWQPSSLTRRLFARSVVANQYGALHYQRGRHRCDTPTQKTAATKADDSRRATDDPATTEDEL